MKRLLFFVPVLILVAFSSDNRPAVTHIDELFARIEKGADTTYVVNFWATWCAPCVAELHYFTELDTAYAKQKVKVILVSLDFKKDIDTKLVPFIKKRKIKTEVLFLDELRDDEWIPKVDSSWQGNLPATLIRNQSKQFRKFIPRETNYPELDSLVRKSQH